jgi:hypothetical protein
VTSSLGEGRPFKIVNQKVKNKSEIKSRKHTSLGSNLGKEILGRGGSLIFRRMKSLILSLKIPNIGFSSGIFSLGILSFGNLILGRAKVSLVRKSLVERPIQ